MAELDGEHGLHRLVPIRAADLRCATCGSQASVASGASRVVATGVRVGTIRKACEACLAEWRTGHKCR
jgi:hypothetical protein